MSETNGQGKSRLDCIEEMIERNEALNERRMLANDKAHEHFEAEHRNLLTAQIVMNDAITKTSDAMTKMSDAITKIIDAMTKIIDAMTKMGDAITKMGDAITKMAAGMSSLELKMEETTGKLNALIDTVDGIIRKRDPIQ